MADASSDNPILATELPIPFDRIRAEHVEPAARALVDEAKQRLESIGERRATRSFDDTVGALDRLTERLDRGIGFVAHLEAVATTPELRAAFNAIQPDVTAFQSSITLHEGAWNALKEFAASGEAKHLDKTRRRLLDKQLGDFRRNGADLGPDGKKALAALEVELAQVTLKFSENVLDATHGFELFVDDKKKLAGLPESALSAAKESAAAKGHGGYRLTLQAPSYIAAMTYLDDRSIREQMFRAYNARATTAPFDNRPVVAKILELRRAKAELLGYASFADLVTEDRMAKSGAAARAFIRTLREKTEPFFARENQELLAFRRTLDGPDAPPLEAWDVAYYAEKLRKARYDFDDEALRPYFPLDRVLAGAFGVAEKLYGLRVEPWASAPTWDARVQGFVLREASGDVASRFYVDVFPRESKRDGAWMDGLITATHPGARAAAGHVEALVGNFTPPVGDRPALLTHREVETTFHEFGHLLHHASSRVPFHALAGTSVARDFVELPSQLMENWCWEREALDRFARHVETGALIPDELFTRMRAARTFRAASAMMRQLGFAELDLALHIDWRPELGDPIAMARTILEKHSAAKLPSDHAMTAAFTHLFANPVGYAAGYYSYKWAEVLEADAFSRFRQGGLLSRDVGDAFRASILSRGDSEDPMELYRAFMGREPSLDALFERDGLVSPAAG